MTKSGIAAVIMLGAIASANAAPQCYKATEIEADQAVRYQAKLMVLSDSCRSNSYSEFVHRNAEVIRTYQHQLIDYFRRINGHRPEDAFDRFLTRIANQIALTTGQVPLDTLCGKAANFLAQAVTFGKEEFRHFVAHQAAEESKSYQNCAD
jgi:hypothetical protein